MEPVVEELLHSPKLPLYYRELRDVVQAEQRQREQFYASMTEQQKVEFINGEIVAQSPAKLEHGIVAGNLFKLLDTYVMVNEFGFVGHEKFLITLTRNDYEPDICFWRPQKAAQFRPGQMKFPAPDFIVEVLSPSTAANDRTIKFDDYALHGVREYWLIEPTSRLVERYELQGETYELAQKTDSGILKSMVVEGFQLPVAALFESSAYLAAMRAMMTSG